MYLLLSNKVHSISPGGSTACERSAEDFGHGQTECVPEDRGGKVKVQGS